MLDVEEGDQFKVFDSYIGYSSEGSHVEATYKFAVSYKTGGRVR